MALLLCSVQLAGINIIAKNDYEVKVIRCMSFICTQTVTGQPLYLMINTKMHQHSVVKCPHKQAPHLPNLSCRIAITRPQKCHGEL